MDSYSVIESHKKQVPEAVDILTEISRLGVSKLHYQLSEKMREYITTFCPRELRSEFWTNFVFANFASKISLNDSVLLLSTAAESLNGTEGVKLMDAFKNKFMSDLEDSSIPKDAYVQWQAQKVLCLISELDNLKSSRSEEVLRTARTLLDELEDKLNNVDWSYGIQARSRSCFYRAQSEYYKSKNDLYNFYQQSILYLAYTPLADIRPDERAAIAYRVGVSLVAAEGLFDFGEFFQQPLLKTIRETATGEDRNKLEYLSEMIGVLYNGTVTDFDKVIEKHSTAIFADPFLSEDVMRKIVRPKMLQSALMGLIFEEPKKKRSCITYAFISSKCKIPLDEVEDVVISAMSSGLIDGKIDEVGKYINVRGTRPGVLPSKKLLSLAGRLAQWGRQTNNFLETQEGRVSAWDLTTTTANSASV